MTSCWLIERELDNCISLNCGSDRQSMRAKGLVMGLYDNLDDKLFCTLAGSYTYTLGNRVWATFTYLYVHGVANPRIEDG